MKLVIASRNAHKIQEIRAMLSDLAVELLDLTGFTSCSDVVEDQPTLEGNALKKARAAFACTGIPSFADDSGLEVYYLLGEPGVYSARYAGENVTYADNNRLLVEKLRGVPDRRRHARFRTVIALVGIGTPVTVEGICEGKIVFEERGTEGFGYDPLFQPKGCEKTYAEMNAEEKNRISHRARAIEKFRDTLRSLKR